MFKRGPAIDPSAMQHSLRKYANDPRRKQAEVSAADNSQQSKGITKSEYNETESTRPNV